MTGVTFSQTGVTHFDSIELPRFVTPVLRRLFLDDLTPVWTESQQKTRT